MQCRECGKEPHEGLCSPWMGWALVVISVAFFVALVVVFVAVVF